MQKTTIQLFFYLISIIGYNTFAQKQNNQWRFGTTGAVDFNTVPPSFVAGAAITTETVSLTVNSNQVLDNITARSISPQTNNHVNNAMPFFPLYRQLSGNDDIKFTVTGSGNLTLNLVLYFLP
jgi:hypothetical protein